MNGSCHCGQVQLRVPSLPARLNACNCSVCLKLGAMWGYFPPAEVEILGDTQAYLRADVEEPRLSFHFCGRCGATTNWSSLGSDGQDRMGVNMRLFDPAGLKGIEVQYGDHRNHDVGRHFYREPTVFDGAGAEA